LSNVEEMSLCTLQAFVRLLQLVVSPGVGKSTWQAPPDLGVRPALVRGPDWMSLRRTEILGGLTHEHRFVA
jgi:hypothetical protein